MAFPKITAVWATFSCRRLNEAFRGDGAIDEALFTPENTVAERVELTIDLKPGAYVTIDPDAVFQHLDPMPILTDPGWIRCAPGGFLLKTGF